MKKYLTFTICSLLLLGAEAQKVVSVAKQQFEEKVAYQPGDVLNLDLEKVQVTIVGKDQDFYAFDITLKSRHKEQEQAIKELDYLKYGLERRGDTIHFSNDFITGDRFRKVQGVLNIELRITAPRSSALSVVNAYGKTYVQNISARIDLKGKFVETKLNECQGILNIVSAFGDHQVNEHKGNITLDLSRVNFLGSEIAGDVIGKTSYGSVEINELSTDNLDFDSRRTAFKLDLNSMSLQDYHFDLFTQLGQILLEGSINEKKSNQWKNEGVTDASIKITTTYSPIIIRDQSLKARKK